MVKVGTTKKGLLLYEEQSVFQELFAVSSRKMFTKHNFTSIDVTFSIRIENSIRLLQRDAEAIRSALYLGFALTIAWIIGAAGLSLAWLVLVLALTATIFKTRISRLLDSTVHRELARLRRKRALYKDETAEWLTLLLNKW